MVVGGDVDGRSAELYDPSLNAWTVLANLSVEHVAHTATLLANGQVLVAGGLTHSVELYDPVTAAWSTVSNLGTVRTSHTATLLPNGQVLVAGGSANAVLDSAEVYDPASQTWSFTGSLSSARFQHTAVLLSSGSVLVAGGSGNSVLNSTELYNPENNPWAPLSSLNTARYSHAATLLADGRLLVSGGINDFVLSSAEVYEPISNTWSPVASLKTARNVHTATLLTNGNVLVVGGNDNFYGVIGSAEVYDPLGNTWTVTATPSSARVQHTATLLPNGQVLVVGGYDENGSMLATTELYDPQTNSFTLVGNMSDGRGYHTATLLPGGFVLVCGGLDSNFVATTSAEIYDPVSMTWSAVGAMQTARYLHSATALPGGQVLVAGGYDGNGSSAAEIFDAASGTWSPVGSLAIGRAYHTATLMPNGSVLVAGGFDVNKSTISKAEVYDPSTKTWSGAGRLGGSRGLHTATLLPTGKVFVAAGAGAQVLGSTEVYDPSSSAWTLAASLGGPRSSHTSTLLPNGKVLVAAGQVLGNTFNPLNSAELFDPSTATWSPAANLNFHRYNHSATLLPNGKVLVAGGVDDGYTIIRSAELYDPVANTWTPTASLISARQNHTATLLRDGQVLVVGGDNGSSLNSAELYDPVSNTWSPAGNLKGVRTYHTATLLPDGQVLVTGGYTTNYLRSAELYNPANKSWTAAANLTTARAFHTATLLPNGQVLLAGGYNGKSSGALNSSELYDPVNGTWIPTSTDLRAVRAHHTAVLTPSGKVLVAGGSSGSSILSSAEAYDPATDTWSSVGNLTTARVNHTATLLLTGQILVAAGDTRDATVNLSPLTPLDSAELTDDGLHYQAGWRPIITASTPALGLGVGGNALVLIGLRFTGISEASNGSSNNSASNYPVVELRSLSNDQIFSLSLSPTNPFGATQFTSLALPASFPQGFASDTVFTNGIPSVAVVVRMVRLSFTPETLPSAKAGVTYSQLITASNGTAPYHSFSIVDGILPAGLGLSSGGLLSGIATKTGVFSFTVGAQDSTPVSGAHAYTLTVNQLVPTQTIAASNSAQRSPTQQVVKLSASVVASSGNAAVNEGTVTFIVLDSSQSEVGTAVTSSTLVNGAASADYTLPANMNVGQYTIKSTFNGTENFDASNNTSTLFVITPGGGIAPAVQIISIDRNPARIQTPITITAQGNSFSGLPLTYTWVLFNHGGQLPIGSPLQTGPSNVLTYTFLSEGDFDIGVSASDSYAGTGTVQRLRVLPLEPNSGSNAPNIFTDGAIVGNVTNALGIRIASSIGGALNVDSIPNTSSPNVSGAQISSRVAATDAETYTFKLDGQETDPNALKAANSAAKFSSRGIHVIQLDATQGASKRQARVMVPIGNTETGEAVKASDTRSSSGAVKYALKGKLSQVRTSSVKMSSTIEISEGLLLSDLGEIEFGISNFHTKITVDSRGKVVTGPDDPHFSAIRVLMPKTDSKSHKTAQGATMTILFTLLGGGKDLADNGLGTDGVAPTTRSAQSAPQPRALQFAAVVAGVTYQSKLEIVFAADGDFGTVAGRSKK